jgi:transposase-like protein
MPPVARKNPVRAKSSESQYSLMEFMREFPDDDACLDWLWRNRCSEDGKHAECPKCEKFRPFKKYATKQRRQSWTCTGCGHHLQPTAGTIFHGSSTSLHLWFYALHLMTSTRCGLSAKQLEREIGVTYKTAWRMLNLIRNELMDESEDGPLSGDVEVDETYYGGRPRGQANRTRGAAEIQRSWSKTPVLAMVERGGRVKTRVLPNTGGPVVKGTIYEHVLPESMIFTDEWMTYNGLDKTYRGHRRIKHKAKIYVDGDTHTQTVEGFFGLFKSGVRGTYHAVSRKWLQSYVNEYAWRYNRRNDGRAMFEALLMRATA